MASIVLMLPVKRRAMLAAVGGAGVALVGVGLFTYVYLYNRVVTTPDYSGPIIGVYTVGVAVVASVAALIPVVTGENSFYSGVDWEQSGDHPDVMIGEANRGPAFAVYRSADGWNWRLIDEDGNMMADSDEEHDSRDGAASSMMTLKQNAPDIDLLEIETVAFELFHDEHGS